MKRANKLPNPFTQGKKKEKTEKYKNDPSKIKHTPQSDQTGKLYKGRYV